MESLDSRIWGFQQKSLISTGLTIKPQEMVTLVKANEDGNLKVEFGPCSMGNKCRERCPRMRDSRTPGVLSNWAGFPQSPWLLCQHLFCQLLLLSHFPSLWESHKAPSLSSPLLSLSLILQYLHLLTWGQSHPCADDSPIHFSTPALSPAAHSPIWCGLSGVPPFDGSSDVKLTLAKTDRSVVSCSPL